MDAVRSKFLPGSLTPAVAFGAAVAVNLVLFSAVARLNRAVDVDPQQALKQAASFMVQDLPPEPPIQAPPKEEPPKPKPESANQAVAPSDSDPSPQPPLELGLSPMEGLSLPLGTGSGAGGAARTPKPETAAPRIYRGGEVDRQVQKVSCASVLRPALMGRRQNLSATVTVRAIVDAQGGVRSLRAVSVKGSESEANEAFVAESLRHFGTCRFIPARKNGQAVSQWVERVYEFSNRG